MSNNICVGFNGNLLETPNKPVVSTSAPTASQYQYKVGQIWIQLGGSGNATIFMFGGSYINNNSMAQGMWIQLGTNASAQASTQIVLNPQLGMTLNPLIGKVEKDLELVPGSEVNDLKHVGWGKFTCGEKEYHIPLFEKKKEEKAVEAVKEPVEEKTPKADIKPVEGSKIETKEAVNVKKEEEDKVEKK